MVTLDPRTVNAIADELARDFARENDNLIFSGFRIFGIRRKQAEAIIAEHLAEKQDAARRQRLGVAE